MLSLLPYYFTAGLSELLLGLEIHPSEEFWVYVANKISVLCLCVDCS